MKVSCEGYKLSAEDVVYDKNLTETCFTENVLQKLILRYWEMQWNKARFQTQIIRESLCCGTSPGNIELQPGFVKVQ